MGVIKVIELFMGKDRIHKVRLLVDGYVKEKEVKTGKTEKIAVNKKWYQFWKKPEFREEPIMMKKEKFIPVSVWINWDDAIRQKLFDKTITDDTDTDDIIGFLNKRVFK